MENLTSVTFNVPSATHLNTGKLKTNVLRVKKKIHDFSHKTNIS